jgi:hypothetical protein
MVAQDRKYNTPDRVVALRLWNISALINGEIDVPG